MDGLKDWLQRQFDEKLVEPNSALGEAIRYLLKRWGALTHGVVGERWQVCLCWGGRRDFRVPEE
jgi:hypothetical protein